MDISVCARHCADQQAERADENAGRHDFLIEIAEYGIHDLAISGAEYLLDDGEVRGIVLPGQRRVIAYRKSALIVPKGNPAKIGSIADLAKPGIRVGISVIDCLKGVWEDVSARAGLTGEIGRNITFRATGIGMLSFTKQPDSARRFMDFLTTPEARASYSRYGWVLPEQLRD